MAEQQYLPPKDRRVRDHDKPWYNQVASEFYKFRSDTRYLSDVLHESKSPSRKELAKNYKPQCYVPFSFPPATRDDHNNKRHNPYVDHEGMEREI